jgi:hypothetical protein
MDFLSLLTQGSPQVPKKKKKKSKPVQQNLEARGTDRLLDFSQNYDKTPAEVQEDFIKILRLVQMANAINGVRQKQVSRSADPPVRSEEEEDEEEAEEGEEGAEDAEDQESTQGKELPMSRVFTHLKKFDPRFDGCLASMSISMGTLKLICQNSPALHPRFQDGAEIVAREVRLQEAAAVQTAATHYVMQGLSKTASDLEQAQSDIVVGTALMMHALTKLYAFLVADVLEVSREEAQTMALLPRLPAETHALMLQSQRFPGGGGGSTLPAARPSADASAASGDGKPSKEQRTISAPPSIVAPSQSISIASPRSSIGALLTPAPAVVGLPSQLRFPASRPKKAKPKPKKAATASSTHIVRKRT